MVPTITAADGTTSNIGCEGTRWVPSFLPELLHQQLGLR